MPVAPVAPTMAALVIARVMAQQPLCFGPLALGTSPRPKDYTFTTPLSSALKSNAAANSARV
jgi:hypothetical protein